MRETIHSDGAPGAIGPYSQAIKADGLVWISGQLGMTADGLLADGVEAQTRQALANLVAILQAAGSSPDRVVRCTIYLVDLADFETVNRVYGEIFDREPPARACVQVAALPKGGVVEIDAIAVS